THRGSLQKDRGCTRRQPVGCLVQPPLLTTTTHGSPPSSRALPGTARPFRRSKGARRTTFVRPVKHCYLNRQAKPVKEKDREKETGPRRVPGNPEHRCGPTATVMHASQKSL